MNIKKTIEQFSTMHIGVIGDFMLDKSIYGDIERISPEAPVPIVSVTSELEYPGGAANAANNAAGLGSTVHVLSVVGDDDARDHLVNYCEGKGMNTEGFLVDFSRPTIQKIRVFKDNHLVIRYDYESTDTISEELAHDFLKLFEKKIAQLDAVIISDYNKGMNNPVLFRGVIDLCAQHNKPVVIDSKTQDLSLFTGAAVFKPNHIEAQKLTGIKTDTETGIIAAGEKLARELSAHILLTCSERGMYAFEKSGDAITHTHIPTHAKHVVDVTGAGDTVIATFTLALAAGASLVEAAQLGSKAVGIVVGEPGTAIISSERLRNEETV